MSEEVSDLEYVEQLLADFDLRPSDRIGDLIEALEQEEVDTTEPNDKS